MTTTDLRPQPPRLWLGAFFAVQYLHLTGLLSTVAENIVRSLLVLNIFWAF
ncbi:MAG: hypothetical protein OEM59_20210 [Rhodospirillales bacterium]|nr:hypothetical protein [Rhodospirillales bacterium]